MAELNETKEELEVYKEGLAAAERRAEAAEGADTPRLAHALLRRDADGRKGRTLLEVPFCPNSVISSRSRRLLLLPFSKPQTPPRFQPAAAATASERLRLQAEAASAEAVSAREAADAARDAALAGREAAEMLAAAADEARLKAEYKSVHLHEEIDVATHKVQEADVRASAAASALAAASDPKHPKHGKHGPKPDEIANLNVIVMSDVLARAEAAERLVDAAKERAYRADKECARLSAALAAEREKVTTLKRHEMARAPPCGPTNIPRNIPKRAARRPTHAADNISRRL